MVEPDNSDLSITAQCRLLSISRSGYYYAPVPENGATLALMALIDQVFMDCPWYGSRQMARHLQRMGHAVGRRRGRRLMAKMGLVAITSAHAPATRTLSTGSIPICCAIWRSRGPTRCGART